MPYQITITNLFRRPRPGPDSIEGPFDTAEAAIVRAKEIIERSIRKSDFTAMTPKTLYQHYSDHGDAAYVQVLGGRDLSFGGWEYAWKVCKEIAGLPGPA